VLTPIRRPAESSSGPPELPGLIAASGLNDVGNLAAAAGREPPLQGADDAGGERLIETERIADGERRLPDLRSPRCRPRSPAASANAAQTDNRKVVVRCNAEISPSRASPEASSPERGGALDT